ncbi:anaerobic C4-dicarboxylate transporter [Gregarina niphandrodes]|uniref:Anaerobic C4-dicarboxylate transporter n=1 Tax=Gregarina niphandrodes TaxID=110365 RepID=A0A023B7Q1_GRENI|nr:anaerobic C4-dicarboxylate transporter [Gregarina niphandrodes]EZG67656.1 anaerobic C4-dicarboxylate transporter [Gregarina niphandrodes]|eukprot:XP_011130174.1 anaerobic C4-dicarboxylate transporter [Gregarina niphandrodes]
MDDDGAMYTDLTRTDWSEAKKLGFTVTEFLLILCAVLLGQYMRGIGHTFVYMFAILFFALAFQMRFYAFGTYINGYTVSLSDLSVYDIRGLDYFSVYIFNWVATLSAGAVVQASGGFLVFEKLLVSIFRNKARLLMPLGASLIGVFCAGVCGTDAVIVLFIAPFVNAAKILGQRPSKALSGLIVSGIIGAACSPLNAAVHSLWIRSFLMNEEMVSFATGCWVNIPAAIVGAIVAGGVATFMGRDLKSSKTFHRRLEEGLVCRPGSQQSMYFPVGSVLRNSRGELESSGGQMSHRSNASQHRKTKLQTAFSLESRLSAGDFVFTEVAPKEGSFVDINDRIARRGEPSSAGPVSAAPTSGAETVGPRSYLLEGSMMVSYSCAYRTHEQYRPVKYTKITAWVSVGLYITACVFAFIWAVLRSTPQRYSTNESSQAGFYPDNIVHLSWSPPQVFVYAVSVMAISLVTMLANRLPSCQVERSSVIRFGFIGFISSLAFYVLGTCWLADWPEFVHDIIQQGEDPTKDNHPWTRIFWIFIMAIFTGDSAVAHRMIAPLVTWNNSKLVEWIASSVAMGASSIVLPTNGNMIAASEIDDTGSTRMGLFLFDHVFIVPGLCGVAAAWGIAYALAHALVG